MNPSSRALQSVINGCHSELNTAFKALVSQENSRTADAALVVFRGRLAALGVHETEEASRLLREFLYSGDLHFSQLLKALVTPDGPSGTSEASAHMALPAAGSAVSGGGCLPRGLSGQASGSGVSDVAGLRRVVQSFVGSSDGVGVPEIQAALRDSGCPVSHELHIMILHHAETGSVRFRDMWVAVTRCLEEKERQAHPRPTPASPSAPTSRPTPSDDTLPTSAGMAKRQALLQGHDIVGWKAEMAEGETTEGQPQLRRKYEANRSSHVFAFE
ncbi:hypothetical protein KIPB_009085 [Kipferlia bialata]|uniref:Uncharacterized protein n=1 Tax=Kipferlia bialata TaxID=797122 RepID=A0A9K3D330_9EUKA|nr:hypothetical protein KIPB_009085 [Kipferlia bialata]|eukprot:g9085.t1